MKEKLKFAQCAMIGYFFFFNPHRSYNDRKKKCDPSKSTNKNSK